MRHRRARAAGAPPRRGMNAGTDPLALARAALAGADAWLVGGAVRDRLLGRGGAELDLDVALEGDAAPLAAALRAAAPRGTAAFALSDAFGGWRVVGPRRSLAGGPHAAAGRDTRRRPARARPDGQRARRAARRRRAASTRPAASPICAPRRLRMVAPEAFDADPLRVLRLARLSVELGFDARAGDARRGTRARAAGSSASPASGSSPSCGGIVGGPEPLAGLERSTRSARPRSSCPSSTRCAGSSRPSTTTTTSTGTRSRSSSRRSRCSAIRRRSSGSERGPATRCAARRAARRRAHARRGAALGRRCCTTSPSR